MLLCLLQLKYLSALHVSSSGGQPPDWQDALLGPTGALTLVQKDVMAWVVADNDKQEQQLNRLESQASGNITPYADDIDALLFQHINVAEAGAVGGEPVSAVLARASVAGSHQGGNSEGGPHVMIEMREGVRSFRNAEVERVGVMPRLSERYQLLAEDADAGGMLMQVGHDRSMTAVHQELGSRFANYGCGKNMLCCEVTMATK